MTAEDRRRIDKWLWFARFARTRTLAQKLAVSGQIRVNKERVESASRTVRIGDVLTLASDRGVRIVRVAALGERRGPAPEAVLLYDDLTPVEATPVAPVRRGPRPTKRDRRQLAAVRGTDGEDFSAGDD